MASRVVTAGESAHNLAAIGAGLLLLAVGGGMQFFLSPLWVVVVLVGTALLAAALMGGGDLREGLALFAFYWPPLWVVVILTAGWWDNRNVAAVWSVAAILVLLSKQGRYAWLGVAANFILLVWLGSRGALLGLWAGLLVMLWRWPAARRVMLAALALLPALLWLRPETAVYRLWYWQRALLAWQSSPWVGIGYGGIRADCWIPEPGGGCQIHAHNVFMHVLAEFGAVGLAALALALGLLLATRRPRWQWALLAALLAHSMVDMPILWPGVAVLLLALVAASPRK